MRKLADRQGVALILTISILTAICILGLSFMLLLRRDQKESDFYADVTSSTGVIEAAYKYGIDEIRKMSDLCSNSSSGGLSTYFGSTIESADSLYSLYFKNVIWATNAKLNLYQCGPEMNATFHALLENFKPQIENNVKEGVDTLIAAIMAYSGDWKLNELNEVARVFDNTSSSDTPLGIKVYNQIQLYTTVYPNRFSDLSMNVIDYGHVADADNLGLGGTVGTLTADKRNFLPKNYTDMGFEEGWDPLTGAYIEIIAGPGFDPENPNINRVLNVDTTNKNKLILKYEWPTGKEPTDKSTYKLYSYTIPINFNAADKTVLKSVFDIMEKYNPATGINAAKVMEEVAKLRPNNAETQRINNYQEFEAFLRDRSKCSIGYDVDNDYYRSFVKRLMDLEEPKGWWNSTSNKWDIYPLPVPLCFTHNGYFDMAIQAGYKRNSQSATAIPRNLQKRKTTVKVYGSYEQTSRADFEKGAFYQNWMCSSDWVPVRNMSDYAGWEFAKNISFQACLYSETNATSPTVIPDALKTGLWLDFGAESEGRGEDEIFSQIADSKKGALVKAKNICSSDFFGKDVGADPVIDIANGRMEIKGTSTSSASGITLGKGTSIYDFGEIGIMTRVEDLKEFSEVFPHPTISELLWYSGITTSTELSNHLWTQHTAATDSNRNPAKSTYSWPPERWFTPTVFIRDNIEFRPEKKFDDNDTYIKCDIPISPTSERKLAHDFSISKKGEYQDRMYHVGSNYISDYGLNINLCRISGNNIIEVNANGIKKVDFTGGSWTTILGAMSDTGKVGFKRAFGSDYYGGPIADITRPFGVYYLRINPGKVNSADKPYYTSSIISLPKATKLKQIKIYYKLGLRKNAFSDTTLFEVSKDSVAMDIELEMQLAYDGQNVGFSASSPTISKSAFDINTFAETQGVAYFDLKDWSKDNWEKVTNTTNTLGYRLTLVNTGTTPEQRFAYLNTTIAITRVELYYDSETEIFSSSDPSF